MTCLEYIKINKSKKKIENPIFKKQTKDLFQDLLKREYSSGQQTDERKGGHYHSLSEK